MSPSFERVNVPYPGARAGVFDATLSIRRGELGVVLLFYALFPHMRLWENVAYVLRVRGVARDGMKRRSVDMLRRVGMEGRENDLPASLSGGQQQRVALARALVVEPRGLLLGEPLSALDASLRMEMRDEILRVQRRAGVAALLVTHDQAEALSIADKVVVMSKGRLAQIGAPRDLYEAPATAEIAASVGQSNLWPGGGVAPGLIEAPIGRLACATQGRAVGEAVIALARPERLAPTEKTGGSNVFCGESVADRYRGPVRRVDLKVARGVVRLETHLRGAVRCVRIPPELEGVAERPTQMSHDRNTLALVSSVSTRRARIRRSRIAKSRAGLACDAAAATLRPAITSRSASLTKRLSEGRFATSVHHTPDRIRPGTAKK